MLVFLFPRSVRVTVTLPFFDDTWLMRLACFAGSATLYVRYWVLLDFALTSMPFIATAETFRGTVYVPGGRLAVFKLRPATSVSPGGTRKLLAEKLSRLAYGPDAVRFTSIGMLCMFCMARVELLFVPVIKELKSGVWV
jgi:hypothetical protein